MNPEDFHRAEEIFARVTGASDRAAALDEACAGDTALRKRVEALLSAHDRAGAFLENPPSTRGFTALAAEQPDASGQRFGAYEAVRRLGAGGMGAVYLCKRTDEQFDKEVAVKVIHRWMDTSEIEKRFERERRLLAQLQHPNIAMLLDAGVSETGAPYIVMERVDGRPIDEHCRAHALSVEGRLHLFLDVCHAVQAAHNALVVHLDLKPSNILVTDEGLVKLVDFGVSQLLDDAEGASAPSRAFTPAYAAPEQIDARPLTTATDVYALGAVLYQLLAGVRPFSLPSETSVGIEQTIRSNPPTPPSTAARTGERDDRAATRLRRRLEGDLDTIVLKAMRKDPAERYASPAALADDVRRHLEGRTVEARQPTLTYRASRFLRRNRAGVAAASLIMLALAGGLIGVSWQARAAAAQRDRAEQRFTDLRRLTNVLVTQVDERLADLPGSVDARRAIVSESTAYLDSLAAELDDEPDLLLEVAASYNQLASLQRNMTSSDLGDTAAALRNHTRARELRERALELRPEDLTIYRDLSETAMSLGDMHRAQGDFDAAVSEYQDAARFSELADPSGESLDAAHIQGVTHTKIGIVGFLAGDLDQAEHAYQRSFEINREIVERDPTRLIDYRNKAVSLEKLGDIRQALGDAQGSYDYYVQAHAIYEDLAAREPNNARHMFTLAVSHSKLGEVLGHPSYANLDDIDGALREYNAGRALTQRMVEADPADARARGAHAFFGRRLGTLLSVAGRLEDALEYQFEAHEAAVELSEADPTDIHTLADVATTRMTIAEVYDQLDNRASATDWRNRAIAVHNEVLALNPDLIRVRVELAMALRENAEWMVESHSEGQAGSERLDDAEALLISSVELLEPLAEQDAAAQRELEITRAELLTCREALAADSP